MSLCRSNCPCVRQSSAHFCWSGKEAYLSLLIFITTCTDLLGITSSPIKFQAPPWPQGLTEPHILFLPCAQSCASTAQDAPQCRHSFSLQASNTTPGLHHCLTAPSPTRPCTPRHRDGAAPCSNPALGQIWHPASTAWT
jgi:hypothetical protein